MKHILIITLYAAAFASRADWVVVDTNLNQVVTVVHDRLPPGFPAEGFAIYRPGQVPPGVTNAPVKVDNSVYRDQQSKTDLRVETLEDRVRNLQLTVYVLAGLQNGTITNGERIKFIDAGGEAQTMRSDNLLNVLTRWLRKTIKDWAP